MALRPFTARERNKQEETDCVFAASGEMIEFSVFLLQHQFQLWEKLYHQAAAQKIFFDILLSHKGPFCETEEQR